MPKLYYDTSGIKTLEEIDTSNEYSKNKVKGLWNGLISGEIIPSLSNIGLLIGSTYNAYISPETTILGGTAPIPGLVRNPEELITKAKEAEKLAQTINSFTQFPKSQAYEYYLSTRKPEVLPVPVKRGAPKILGQGNTAKAEDKAMKISKEQKLKEKYFRAFDTGDNRPVNSGRNKIAEARTEYAKEMMKKYPSWYNPYLDLLKKFAKAEAKGNTARVKELKKQLKQHLENFRNIMGYKQGGNIFKFQKGKKIPAKKVDFYSIPLLANNNRAMHREDLSVLQDSLINRGYGFPLRMAILATAALEMDERGHASKGVGGNGYGGLSILRMPIKYLKDRGKLITYYLNDLETTHSDNWLDGGSGGPTILNGKEGHKKFWNAVNIENATKILNKSYTRPRDREEAWNNRAQVARNFAKYAK